MTPTSQGLLTLDLVMWSSSDNHATTCHGGRLVGHPPRRQSWALRVPTLVSCYFGLVYFIDTSFRLQDQWFRMLPHSRIGCRVYAPLYRLSGFVPHFPHVDSRRSSRLALFRVPIIHQSHSLTFLRPISSSSAGLYFLSSIIISHCIPLARLLEPSGLHLAHPMWSPTSRCSFDPCSPRNPTDTSCSDCLRPAQDLAVALAESLLVWPFSCEDTHPQALVLSRQPLTRALH